MACSDLIHSPFFNSSLLDFRLSAFSPDLLPSRRNLYSAGWIHPRPIITSPSTAPSPTLSIFLLLYHRSPCNAASLHQPKRPLLPFSPSANSQAFCTYRVALSLSSSHHHNHTSSLPSNPPISSSISGITTEQEQGLSSPFLQSFQRPQFHSLIKIRNNSVFRSSSAFPSAFLVLIHDLRQNRDMIKT